MAKRRRSGSKKKAQGARDALAEKNFREGIALLSTLPIPGAQVVYRSPGKWSPTVGWTVVLRSGSVHANPARIGDPQEWAWAIGHSLLHLCFEHFKPQPDDQTTYRWNLACDLYIARFLYDLGLPPPDDIGGTEAPPTGTEQQLFDRMEYEIPDNWLDWGTGGNGESDMIFDPPDPNRARLFDWPGSFADRIARSARQAVAAVGAGEDESPDGRVLTQRAGRAISWFISSYPLLGAMAASFDLIDDLTTCQTMDIQIAAVSPELKEIYLNPTAVLSTEELRFVIAHEFLHVGLGHDRRTQGRDPYLWNVACDYVINGWLVEMRVGEMPDGVLFDHELLGRSADEIYDIITRDLATMRRYRRLATFAGRGRGDVLPSRSPGWWRGADGVKLDDFYRSALTQGLDLHYERGRGTLPAGLVEDIRALSHPPIRWDVELARWFDEYFPPVERRRTYARVSRRQSATPDIPRPHWHTPAELIDDRTFAVVLDTSGSMDRQLLGKGLGAIASYAASRDVQAVRLVFCDAAYHDQGYVQPERLGDRVRVVGRGGTVLQPAISFLQRTPDFPKAGPILIITDGDCDRLSIEGGRPHGFLIPAGARLPFTPRGEVFLIS